MVFWKKKRKDENLTTHNGENLNSNQYQLNTGEDNETTLLTETLEEDGETTLLAETPLYEEDSEGETTLLSEDYYADESEQVEDEEEEYEGQTSLLSEEFSPYLHPEYGNGENYGQRILENNENNYEDEEDDDGATTVLSSNNHYSEQRIYIPDNATNAYLIKIIESEKIRINKIKFIIGSSQGDVDYLINNSAVSRKHAFIIYNEEKYFLVDNKSTNKTLLDGNMLEPLKPAELYHGALIQFSDILFQFVCD